MSTRHTTFSSALRTSTIAAVLVIVPVACSSTPSSTDATPQAAATTVAPTSTPAAPSSSAIPTTANVVPITDALGGLPSGVAGDMPQGKFVVEITDADLVAVNVAPHAFAEDHGTYTWTFLDGQWDFSQVAPNPLLNPTSNGTYVVNGDHMTLNVAADYGPQEFTWAANPDGSIQLTAQASTSAEWAAMLGSHALMPVP